MTAEPKCVFKNNFGQLKSIDNLTKEAKEIDEKEFSKKY